MFFPLETNSVEGGACGQAGTRLQPAGYVTWVQRVAVGETVGFQLNWVVLAKVIWVLPTSNVL